MTATETIEWMTGTKNGPVVENKLKQLRDWNIIEEIDGRYRPKFTSANDALEALRKQVRDKIDD